MLTGSSLGTFDMVLTDFTIYEGLLLGAIVFIDRCSSSILHFLQIQSLACVKTYDLHWSLKVGSTTDGHTF